MHLGRTFGSLACAATCAACLMAFAPHGRAAVISGQIDVVQSNGSNAASAITLTTPIASPGFGVATGSNRGDFNLATSLTNTNGIVMTTVRQNGRDNDSVGGGAGGVDGAPFGGVQRATTAIERTGAAYFIPIFTSPGGDEFNINVAAAYFPYSEYLGGHAFNSAGTNGGANDMLVASPGLVLGMHVIDNGGGQTTIDLRTLNANASAGPVAASSQSGILLVTGGKNEDNYALSQANADGTFTVFSHDNGANGAAYEQDPIAFVYLASNDPGTVALGRIDNEGDTIVGSGTFTVTHPAVGRWLLKINGHTNTTGTLLISAEGGGGGDAGGANNVDNIVSYEWDAAQQGWFIESRDLAGVGLQNGTANEPVFSFAFFAVPEPTTLGLLVPAGAMFLSRRRRRRRSGT